jgi:hypothetical protein
MEQYAAVRFFALKKLSAKDIRAELEAVYVDEALSLSAVKKRRKRFTNGKINLECDPRSERPLQGNPCESVQAFIKEGRFTNCKGMCQKLCIVKTTCMRVMHERLWFRKYSFCWVPHPMTEKEALCRIAFSEELLRVVRHARKRCIKYLLVDDESWFYYVSAHRIPIQPQIRQLCTVVMISCAMSIKTMTQNSV